MHRMYDNRRRMELNRGLQVLYVFGSLLLVSSSVESSPARRRCYVRLIHRHGSSRGTWECRVNHGIEGFRILPYDGILVQIIWSHGIWPILFVGVNRNIRSIRPCWLKKSHQRVVFLYYHSLPGHLHRDHLVSKYLAKQGHRDLRRSWLSVSSYTTPTLCRGVKCECKSSISL